MEREAQVFYGDNGLTAITDTNNFQYALIVGMLGYYNDNPSGGDDMAYVSSFRQFNSIRSAGKYDLFDPILVR